MLRRCLLPRQRPTCPQLRVRATIERELRMSTTCYGRRLGWSSPRPAQMPRRWPPDGVHSSHTRTTTIPALSLLLPDQLDYYSPRFSLLVRQLRTFLPAFSAAGYF
jgi:hypothetical protein